jgi:hypothetical protein
MMNDPSSSVVARAPPDLRMNFRRGWSTISTLGSAITIRWVHAKGILVERYV